MGSWIGGDRDGNPFVTADVLRFAVGRQAATALGHHLRCVERLSVELSMSARLITPTDALLALAGSSGDDSPFRADEPYRRALRGMYARLYAFTERVLGERSRRDRLGSAPRHPGAVRVDRRTRRRPRRGDARRCRRTVPTNSPAPRSEPVRRAAVVFGAHLCGLDMRQNSRVHEQVVAELVAAAGVCDDYAALDEVARVALLEAELASPQAAHHPARRLQRSGHRRDRGVARGGRRHRPRRAARHPALRHLDGRQRERRAGSGDPPQGGRPRPPVAGRRAGESTSTSFPCSRRSTTCGDSARHPHGDAGERDVSAASSSHAAGCRR